MTNEKAHWRFDLLALAASALLLGTALGQIDLWAPDEPRYARIADELRSFEHGASGLLLLHLNGEVYTQKPPLYFWLAALLGAPGGSVSEAAARLPSALAGIACVLLTLQLGRRLLASPLAAALGAGVLLTTFRFAHQARRAQLDVLLCLFELVAMLAFVRLEQGRGGPRRNLALFHGAMGLGVLTKGPVALLPLVVAAAMLGLEGRGRQLRRLVPAWGLFLSIGPGLAWILAASALAPPGYANEAVLDNVVARFFSGTAHVRPFYYFSYQLPLDFLPWTLALPFVAALPALRAGASPRERSGARLLLVWVVVHFLFFSLSAGKRGLYLLPAFPALALLCGAALDHRLRAAPLASRPGVGLVAAGLVLGAVGVAATLSPGLQAWGSGDFSLPRELGPVLVGLGVALAVAAWAVPGRAGRLAAVFAVLYAIELTVFTLVYPAFDPEKSPRPVAQLALQYAESREPLGVFEQRALAGGIAYYAGRSVVALQGEDELAAFVAAGGRSIVVRQSRFRQLASRERFEVRGRVRSGPRTLLVVTPHDVSYPARSWPLPASAPNDRSGIYRFESGVYPTGL